MADMDLGSALTMFKEGAQQLSLSRALDQANQQVQQIKASEMNDQQQRAALQQLSNGLVTHMASIGTPATTIQAVAGAIGPQQFANSNDMYKQGQLTGNQSLMDEAAKTQQFEQNPNYKMQLLDAKYGAMAQQRKSDRDQKQEQLFDNAFQKFGKDIDASQASSRSAFGVWAQTGARGQRLDAILGDPSKWNNLTKTDMELLKEGLVQMSKGAAMTDSEHKALDVLAPQTLLAKGKEMLGLGPQSLDMSKYAGLYKSILDRENSAVKQNMQKEILDRANNYLSLHKKNPEMFKERLSAELNKQGIDASPEDIAYDKKKGFQLNSTSASDSEMPNIVTKMYDGKPTRMYQKDGKWFKAD